MTKPPFFKSRFRAGKPPAFRLRLSLPSRGKTPSCAKFRGFSLPCHTFAFFLEAFLLRSPAGYGLYPVLINALGVAQSPGKPTENGERKEQDETKPTVSPHHGGRKVPLPHDHRHQLVFRVQPHQPRGRRAHQSPLPDPEELPGCPGGLPLLRGGHRHGAHQRQPAPDGCPPSGGTAL